MWPPPCPVPLNSRFRSSQAKQQPDSHRSQAVMPQSGQAPPQEPSLAPPPARSAFPLQTGVTRQPSLWRRILGRAHHGNKARLPAPAPQPIPESEWKPGRKSEPEWRPVSEWKPDPKPEFQSPAPSRPKSQPQPQPQPQPQLQAEPEHEPEPEPKTEPEPQAEPEPKAEPEPEPKAEPEPEPKAEPEPEPEPKTEPEPQAEPEPQTEPAPEPEPQTESEPEAEHEFKVENEPKAEHEPEKAMEDMADELDPDDPRLFSPRRTNRQVVPGLPRALTFKRQKSELRDNLMPAELSADERRALSMDRRVASPPLFSSDSQSNPRSSVLDASFRAAATTRAPVDVDTATDADTITTADMTVDATAYTAADTTADPDATPHASTPTRFPTPTPVPNGLVSSTTVSQLPPSVPSPSLASTAPYGHDPRITVETLSDVEALDLDPTESNVDPRPEPHAGLRPPVMDTASMTTSQYDQMIHDDLERIWILNLSMHFRDKSKREKFFITYRQGEFRWRRVTVSLDYRNAPENSLELDLEHTKFQREKNAKIYEAIRESLQDIQFYDTVTNLKLQTTDGRLHVHVVEDVNEIIAYPTIRMVSHLRCRRVREREIQFDSHMSGFVYKVKVHGQTLIKKEIPGPDTVDEFLYEVNALTQLQDSKHVIELYGVIVDDNEEHVKGLLISYAEQGALIDMIFDNDHRLPWARREKWAMQIVAGLSEIHEAGFVQGDFTLSNIVIDSNDDAKIIDINRRGCPVGWEPPEATPLIESGQRISMYIGVKSDLFQLGMVLWAIATQEDEPEAHSRPLRIDADVDCPRWFREVVDMCLCENPRFRVAARILATMFPSSSGSGDGLGRHHEHARLQHAPTASVDSSVNTYGQPVDRAANSPPPEWTFGHRYIDPPTGTSNEPYYFPTRGRSPPSPIASNRGGLGTARGPYSRTPAWSAYSYDQSHSDRSVSDVLAMDTERAAEDRSVTPRTSSEPAWAPTIIEKELEVVDTPVAAPVDNISEVVARLDENQNVAHLVEAEKAAETETEAEVVTDAEAAAEAGTTTNALPLSPMGELPRSSTVFTGGEFQPHGVPLPPSSSEDTEYEENDDEELRDDAATSESGGASLDWNDMEDDDDRDLGECIPPHAARWETGITEPQSHRDDMTKSFHTATATETETEVIPDAAVATAMGANIERMKTPSTGRWLAIGTESLHGDGASILEVEQATNTPSTPKAVGLDTPPGSGSARDSPIHELPDELKGIGSAHDHSNEEALRAQGSILDDFDRLDGCSTNH
ncbi:hypothetical protein RB598_001571 [Gaeumannomyces tritici]